MAFGYTTHFTETPLPDHTRVIRFYDAGGGTLVNIYTHHTVGGHDVPITDIEVLVPVLLRAAFPTSFTLLLDEELSSGLHRVVRALVATPAGVLIHITTTFTHHANGVTTTTLVREWAYFIPDATLSGTDVVITPPVPSPPP
jgi:hypothetical protein